MVERMITIFFMLYGLKKHLADLFYRSPIDGDSVGNFRQNLADLFRSLSPISLSGSFSAKLVGSRVLSSCVIFQTNA